MILNLNNKRSIGTQIAANEFMENEEVRGIVLMHLEHEGKRKEKAK